MKKLVLGVTAFLLIIFIMFALYEKQAQDNGQDQKQDQKQVQKQAENKTENTTNKNAHATAEKQFKASCVACHGNDVSNLGKQLTKEQLIEVIQKGRGGMPAYQGVYSEAEITNIADWLKSK